MYCSRLRASLRMRVCRNWKRDGCIRDDPRERERLGRQPAIVGKLPHALLRRRRQRIPEHDQERDQAGQADRIGVLPGPNIQRRDRPALDFFERPIENHYLKHFQV